MKKYKIVVVASDATTVSNTIGAKTRKEADSYANGIAFMLTREDKSIFIQRVTPVKTY